MTSASILIVDDEVDNFDVVEMFLSSSPRDGSQSEHYQLHYAASGQEAIALLEICKPDLILLDVMMPEMDGLEVCQYIKSQKQWQAVPIIMVTALSSKADLARCLSAGADDFISKPVNSTELQARVHSMLRIKHQHDELQHLLELREDMVKMIVHDLRNPLSSVILGIDLLKSIDYPPEKQQQRLENIYGSALSLQRLIDDLLQMSLLESGVIRLNYKTVDLSELVQSAIQNFEAIARQKQLTISGQLSNAPQQPASIDSNLIHRTLDNLLSNAIKFSPVKSEIQVTLAPLGDDAFKIQVIDSGPGVSDTLQDRIFEKYEVGTLMDHVDQIGLGLAFCKMVVEAHGGTISVQSAPSAGTVFEVVLPTMTSQTSMAIA
ncbi:MAG: response regulator [Leptolyngbya sp. DLM2.Bin15]|nr:MAG: response regulator [Leptolyngbya sp. DLM2.Bin15]